MQISERVRDIEKITKDIIDLKVRYEDVLQPIKKLTENVNRVTADVGTLAEQTKQLARELDTLREVTGENAKHISELTTGIATMSAELRGVGDRAVRAEDASRQQANNVATLSEKFGKLSIVAYVFWGLLLMGIGTALTILVQKLVGGN